LIDEGAMKILISVGKVSVEAELHDTPTAKKIYAALPITTSFSTWGDEIYFPIAVHEELDSTAKETVQVGDLGYWPTGNAFCIFFGPTPMSKGDEIRPASAVNIVGKTLGDAKLFKQAMNEKSITLKKV
jgi:uncharacterized protein